MSKYVIKRESVEGNPCWVAYRIGWFDLEWAILDTFTTIDPDECEIRLREHILDKNTTPRVVRELEL